jgi:hypothetical protein
VDFKVHDVEDYAALMASLRLPDPKMMRAARHDACGSRGRPPIPG